MNDLVKVEPQDVATVPESSDGKSILSIIARAASDPGVNVDKMERLYAMLKEENARVAEQRFNEAMRKAQSEMPLIKKDAKNPSTNSMFARLETLKKVAVPIINANGFSQSFSQGDGAPAGKIRVLCRVSHIGGHSNTYHLDLSPDDTGSKGLKNKTGIHGEGSTFSYGERYLTKLIFNITIVGEDDDGNQGNRPKPQGPSSLAAEPTVKQYAAQLWELLKPVRGTVKTWDAANKWMVDECIIDPDERAPDFTPERFKEVIEKAKGKL